MLYYFTTQSRKHSVGVLGDNDHLPNGSNVKESKKQYWVSLLNTQYLKKLVKNGEGKLKKNWKIYESTYTQI